MTGDQPSHEATAWQASEEMAGDTPVATGDFNSHEGAIALQSDVSAAGLLKLESRDSPSVRFSPASAK